MSLKVKEKQSIVVELRNVHHRLISLNIYSPINTIALLSRENISLELHLRVYILISLSVCPSHLLSVFFPPKSLISHLWSLSLSISPCLFLPLHLSWPPYPSPSPSLCLSFPLPMPFLPVCNLTFLNREPDNFSLSCFW